MTWSSLGEAGAVVLGIAAFLVFWLVPNPIGKAVEFLNFFRGK
jgi:hypothetical protein